MKKIMVSAAFSILFAAMAFAQLPLTGTWLMTESVMGTTIADYLTFDNDSQGLATNKIVIDLKINIFGVKATGKAELTVNGTFVCEGDKLTIHWNQDSLNVVSTPVTMSYKGEAIEDDTKEFEDMLSDLVKEIKDDIAQHNPDEYSPVRVKGDKLLLTSPDEKGKAETDKFSRVKP